MTFSLSAGDSCCLAAPRRAQGVAHPSRRRWQGMIQPPRHPCRAGRTVVAVLVDQGRLGGASRERARDDPWAFAFDAKDAGHARPQRLPQSPHMMPSTRPAALSFRPLFSPISFRGIERKVYLFLHPLTPITRSLPVPYGLRRAGRESSRQSSRRRRAHRLRDWRHSPPLSRQNP